MKKCWILAALTVTAAVAQKEMKPKPGLNFFSKQQDIQLGKEAANQISQQYAIVSNKDLEDYCNRIIKRLASSPAADGQSYPYYMRVVYEKSINAFALPGGPMFIHTGLISAAENEAQMAAVLAHEMSHVALRHGTNQASKANLIQIPAMIASGVLGNNGMLGQLEAMGVQALAGGVLLKFSRGAERDADVNGARIMHEAGYNPIEMARFFEKLQAETGKQSRFAEFLSDHPNPENRVKTVEEQIKFYPKKNYDNPDPNELARIKQVVAQLPPMQKPRAPASQQGAKGGAPAPSGPAPSIRVSDQFRTLTAQPFQMGYPQEWQVFQDNSSQGPVTVAPQNAVFQTQQGAAYGFGAQASFFPAQNGQADLRRDTDRFIQQLQNAGVKRASGTNQQTLVVDGNNALLTMLNSQSPYQGETEVDILLTVARPQGLFYVIFFAPKSQYQSIEPTFEKMTQSIKFR